MKTIHTYCLTLKDSDRHKWQLEHNKFLGDTITYVYGKTFNFNLNFFTKLHESNNKGYWDWYFKTAKNNHIKDQLKSLNGAYSCMDGHKRIVEQFYNSKYDYGLIIEDDIKLPENIYDVIYKLYNNYGKYGWFHLLSEETISLAHGFNNYSIKKDVYLSESFIGAACYVINKDIAKKYLDNYKGNAIADAYLGLTFKNIPTVHNSPVHFNFDLHINSNLELRKATKIHSNFLNEIIFISNIDDNYISYDQNIILKDCKHLKQIIRYTCDKSLFIKDKLLSNSIEHYNIIKSAYNRKLNHIIVCDIGFNYINNLSIVNYYLNNIPQDYVCCKLYSDKFEYEENANPTYIKVDDISNNNNFNECYLLSRYGMKTILDILDKNIIPMKEVFNKIKKDCYLSSHKLFNK